jgi:hypothetical protein
MVSERPKVISRELRDPARPRGWESHRLHREDGPAVKWDGWGVYSWHGVQVPAEVIEDPASLTVDDITNEPNVEVRRVMLERFGFDRWITETGATKIGSDEYGTLWSFELKDDPEPRVVVVQVTNSSPEPDGSFKDYWLRVDPTCRTAHEAVAWTFGMSTSDYRLAMQT